MKEFELLKDFLAVLKVGQPITQENLTLFPGKDGQGKGLSYLLLEEALVGARQNRMLNTSIMAAADSRRSGGRGLSLSRPW
jgi:hypothetical protein